MIKKALVSISIFISLAIAVLYYLSTTRILGIIGNIIGQDNIQFIKQIDSKTTLGGPISAESYAYKIIDKKIDCNSFDKNSTTSCSLNDFEKKYINSNKHYCCNIFGDEMSRTIYIVVQNDFMIVEVFVD